WLLAGGGMFALGVCLGDVVSLLAPDFSYAWAVVLAAEWAGNATVVAGIGLIGLFPTGMPQRAGERWALRTAAVAAVLLPVLLLISSPTAPNGLFADPADPVIANPLFLPAFGSVGPVAAVLQYTFPVWAVLGGVMLYLRYQRSPSADRRRIRWLLAGAGGAVVLFAAFATLSWALGPGPLQVASVLFWWALTLLLILGSLPVALSNDGVLGIDRSARRAVVYRALWLLIAVVYGAAAAALGLLAGRYLPAGAAVLLAAGAAVAFQPVRRRLERLADRWVFGARLDGYAVLTRFGSMLETSPGPADVLPGLAA